MRGDTAAMVRVTGKPARFTTPLPEGTRLLAVPLSRSLLETYLPATFTSADCPALVPSGEAVETVAVGAVAVGAVLAAYNHTASYRRGYLVRSSRARALTFDFSVPSLRHPK